jgi:hypothetical protein
MPANLQQLVEGLAARLGRSVAIDDPRLHLLAYSPHRGEVDPARAESILRREVSRETVDHVYACWDEDAGVYVVSPREDLGLHDTRLGYPIVHQGSLLGLMWLLLSEGPAEQAAVDAVKGAVDEAAVLIHREYLRAGSAGEREQQLTERLLGADAGDRAAAATVLREESLFSAGPFAVMVAQVDQDGGPVTDADRLALASGLAAVRSRRLPQDVLTLERRDHVLVLVAAPPGETSGAALLPLAEALRDAVRAGDVTHSRVGVSRVRTALEEAPRSVEEARRAVRIASKVGTLGDVSPIEHLGVYEMLDMVPEEALRTMVHPGLLSLLQQGQRTESLVQTLEIYLDSAGDVKTASEQLFSHRTSLYYRLRRIQELTGLDLSNGEDRLVAHLGLRIARLLDLHTP